MQFYNIQAVKETELPEDQHGNKWYNVKLAELPDAVLQLAKNPPSAGAVVYGEVTDVVSRAGKPYKRFYRKQVPEGMAVPAPAAQQPLQAAQEPQGGAIMDKLEQILTEVKKLTEPVQDRTELEVLPEDGEVLTDLSDIPF